MPFEFGDRLNWDLLLREERRGRYPSYSAPKPDPIPPIIISGVTSRIVLVGCKSAGAERHWKLGCYARQRLSISPSSQSEFVSVVQCKERFFCQLGLLTKVEFPEYNSYPYLLVLEIPKWLPDIFIEAWYYSGPDLPQEFETINAALERIESRLP